MFGVGSGEVILILVIAMLVVGPERMVSFAHDAGTMLAKFRRETDSVTSEFKEALSLDPFAGEAEADAVDGDSAPATKSAGNQSASATGATSLPVPESSPPSIAPTTSAFADSEVTRAVGAEHDADSGADGSGTSTVLAMSDDAQGDQVDAYELTVIEGPEVMDDEDSETTITPVKSEG